MRKSGSVSTSTLLLLLVLWLLQLCSGILTGYDQPETDITTNKDYKCEWSGGMAAALRCTCRDEETEMVIQENSIPAHTTEEIEISSCASIKFEKNAIRNLRTLRFIHLHDIAALHLGESSLYWSGYFNEIGDEDAEGPGIPTLKIYIEETNITEISSYTFKGHLGEIRLKGVVIEQVAPYAFALLRQTSIISIEDSELKNIRLQSFKKIIVGNLELKNVIVDSVPSRMFSNITVDNSFVVDKCNFNRIRPGGFIIYNPKHVAITNTRINELDGDAFSIVTRGDVLFKNNTVHIIRDGAFKGIVMNREIKQDKSIVFDSNTFTVLTDDSVSVSGLIPKFENLCINTTCDCESIDRNFKDTQFYSEIKCLYKNEYITVTNFKGNQCTVIRSVSTTIIIVSVVIFLLFIISLVLFIYYRRVYLNKKYGRTKSTKKGNLSLIVPDGRTYRETELHVIVERADLLTTDL